MRKIINLMALAALLFVPWVANGQTMQTIVADGGATDSYIPVYGYWADAAQHNQIVYSEDILDEIPGVTISGMKFYATGSPSWGITATVSMAIVDSPTLNTLNTTATLTQVWTGSVSFSGGEWSMTFDTPFTYTGGNLLVDIVTTAGSYSSGTFNGMSTSSPASVYHYNTTTSSRNFIPKTEFTHTIPVMSCYRPSVVTVSQIDSNNATIEWTDTLNSGATYSLRYWAAGSTDTVYINGLTGSSYSLTGLNAATSYNYGVAAYCSASDSSSYRSGTFKTTCGTVTVPYSIGFEGLSTGAQPDCWDAIVTGVNGSNTFPCAYNYSANTHTGDIYYEFESGSGSSNIEVAALPVMDNISSLKLSMWVSSSSSYPCMLEVGVMEGTTFVPVDTLELITFSGSSAWKQNYNEYTTYFAGYTGNGNRIAIRATRTGSGQFTLFIDDVTVEEFSGCYPATNLTSTAIDSANITLSWQDNLNSGISYTVYYWKDGATDTLSETTTNTTVTLSNLDANSVYNVAVVANCTTGDATPLTGSYRTECGMMAIPFFDNFDSYANGQFPPCWQRIRAYGTDPSVNAQFHHSGSQSMFLLASVDTTLFVTPTAVPLDGNQIQVRYHAYLNYASYYTMTKWIKAGVMTNPNDMSTFIALDSVGYHNFNNVFEEREFNTTALDPTASYYVAWMYYCSMSYMNTGAVDDVSITQVSNCLRPAAAWTSNVGARQAVVTWNEVAGASDYTVYYNTANDPNGANVLTEYVSNDTTVTITNLQPETHYYVWVATSCSGTESDLRPAGDFTTLISCPSVTALTVDTTTSDGATISWTAGDIETEWYLILDSTEIGGVTDTFYTITGLDAMTGHTLYVRAVCGSDDTSSAASINFATGCDDAVCNVTLNMVDSYGDGWNGNAIQVYQAGVMVGSATIPSGNSNTEQIEVCSSAPVEFRYVSGSYASEMGGTITDGGGNTVFTIANMGSHNNGDVLATVNTPCPECVPPTAIAVVDGTITSDGAIINWISQDGQSAWLVRLDTGAAVSVTDTFYTFGGLDARTTHTAYVATDCSGDTSNWVSVQFTTDCSGGSCDIMVAAEDSYGDGWNGATIHFFQNGSPAGSYSMPSQSLYSTRIYDTAYINVCSGIPVTFNWTTGSYDSEITYTVYDGGGSPIYSSATSGVNHTDSIENACPSCITPDSLVLTLVDSNELEFAWRVIDSVYNYLVCFNGGTWESAYTGTYNAFGLTPNTSYTFSVRAVCQPGDTSNARTITVRTSCGQMALPLVENFDSQPVGSTPSCWSVVFSTIGDSPAVSLDDYHSPDNSLMLNGSGMIASSAIPLNGDSIYVSFWSEGDAGLNAGVMTNPLVDSTFISMIVVPSGDWTQYEFNTSSLTNYHDSTFYLAFRFNTGSTWSYAFVDDINIRLNEGCMYPANVVATPGAHDISLVWSNNVSTMDFVVAHRTTGAATWDTTVYVNDTVYTITGLNAATSYEVRVGFLCNSDTLWTLVSTQTNCDVLPLPYFENFDSYANDVMPPCWGWSSVSSTHWDGGVFLRANHGGGTEYVVVPELSGNITKLKVEFDTKVGTPAENDGILIGVADASGTLLAWLDTIQDANFSRNNHVRKTVYFTNYTNFPYGSARVAFAQLRNWNEWALIDNINIEELPNCYPIDSLTIHNVIDPDHTSFTWTSIGLETQWQVYVDTVIADIDSVPDSLLTTVSTRSYEIPMGTIQGGGIYKFYVRSDCGFENSNWTSYEFGAGTVVMNNSTTADTVVGCGLVIYDNGGPIAGYLPNSNSSLVIRAENVGSELQIFGGKFGWGSSSATLTVYDGEGTSGAVLYTYNTIDGRDTLIDTVLATSTTGAMTITFVANGNMCHTGYELYVHCVGAALCERPTQLNAVMTEIGEATVTWSGTASAYDLYYKPTGATNWTIQNTTSNTLMLTGLIPDTTYDMQVVGICGNDTSTASFPIVLNTHYDVVITPCDPITDLTVGTVTNSTAVLSWTSNGNSWEIEVVRVGNTDTVVANTNPFTLTGLLPNMQYTVRVRTACSGVHVDPYSEWSAAETFTTPLDGPQSYTLTVVANNDAWGTVTGGGIYVDGSQATLTATANNGYYFDRWNDGDTNATRIVTVTGNATYTANFAENGTVNNYYHISVSSNNNDWGTVTGSGDYVEGSTATITATANSGYHFVEWNDGVTDTIRTFVVTESASFVATFAANTGIDDVASCTMTLFPNPASSTVTVSFSGIEGKATVEIVDISGRVNGKQSTDSSQLTFDVSNLAPGAYFIRVTGENATAISRLIVR